MAKSSGFDTGFGLGCGVVMGIIAAIIVIPILFMAGCFTCIAGTTVAISESAKEAENARYKSNTPTSQSSKKDRGESLEPVKNSLSKEQTIADKEKQEQNTEAEQVNSLCETKNLESIIGNKLCVDAEKSSPYRRKGKRRWMRLRSNGVTLICEFSEPPSEKLRSIKIGERVRVCGVLSKIEHVKQCEITLQSCSLFPVQ